MTKPESEAVPREAVCRTCDGTRIVSYRIPSLAMPGDPCPDCNGTGQRPADPFTQPFQDTGAALHDMVHRPVVGQRPAEAATAPLVAQEQVRRVELWDGYGDNDYVLASDHDRVVSELKREADNLRVVVGTVERDYKERLATERAAHAATREALEKATTQYIDNRGYVVRSGNQTTCLHGVRLVPRGHEFYKACKPCFNFVCAALAANSADGPKEGG